MADAEKQAEQEKPTDSHEKSAAVDPKLQAENARLTQIIAELDAMIPRDGASVEFVDEDEEEDEEAGIAANRRGFLRFGIEMLKAGVAAPEKEEDEAPVTAPGQEADLSYLFKLSDEKRMQRLANEESQMIMPSAQMMNGGDSAKGTLGMLAIIGVIVGAIGAGYVIGVLLQ